MAQAKCVTNPIRALLTDAMLDASENRQSELYPQFCADPAGQIEASVHNGGQEIGCIVLRDLTYTTRRVA